MNSARTSVEQVCSNPHRGPSHLSLDNEGEAQTASRVQTSEERFSSDPALNQAAAAAQPARASSCSPSKASARSEAGAKMRATLSASPTLADIGTAKFSGASFSASQMTPSTTSHLDVPGAGADGSSGAGATQWSPLSNPPRVPLRSETSLDPLAFDATSSAALNAAPLMSASGRTPSTPGSSPGATGSIASTGAAAANSRARASTSGFSSAPHSAMAPPPHYSSSSQSSRSSPRLRAQAGQHPPPILTLGGMSVHSVAAAPAAFPVFSHPPGHQNTMSAAAYERHTAELTNCIIAFLSPILPTEEEYRIKEATRRQLERLASKVSPGAKLLAFGSMANGFALRNSDMDLCCLTKKRNGQPATQHTPSELVEILSQLIREETDFNVMPLPRARIPIIKISRAPTAELPYEISCDIGFENRLALENTRLLLSYAMVDPPRLRTLVLFLKVWSKRRKLNSPYTGTLSSYGYTLLALYFLTHVKRPAVLPNLQRIPATRQLKPEELELDGHNIYFYDDVATLRKEWSSQNTENVGELLIDFFRYFSKEFSYSKDVVSLRTEVGLLSKDGKSWNAELCIEDPFQMGYNVSRTVTKDGLYTIRGEFMRASRILMKPKSQRVSALIAELCEEREDGLSRAPDGPYPRPRYQQNGPAGVDGRPYRDMYANPRRYDAPAFSGYGGSFAFEQMARGLGQGIAFPPTTAMLAPLSRIHGLSSKPQPPRFANQQETIAISSGQSDTGPPSSYDGFLRASVGHASARTSPSFKHALPNVLHPSSGPNAQEAFAYGAEISFGPEAVSVTRDDMVGSRTKTARSLSESLNRSKSVPRGAAAATAAASSSAAGAATNGEFASRPGTTLPSAGISLPAAHAAYLCAKNAAATSSDDFEGQVAGLPVLPGSEGKRRLSNSSHASSSMHTDGINGTPQPHYYSTSPTWSFAQPGTGQRRGSQSTTSSFHHHSHPHGHAASSLPYAQTQKQQQQHHSYHQHSSVAQHLQQQHSQQQSSYHQMDQQQPQPRQPYQHAQQPQRQPLVLDTRPILQEYLRRASETAETEARCFAQLDNDDACSLISEATLDELARLSAIDSEETTSPQLVATKSVKGADHDGAGEVPASPSRGSLRLPNSVIE